MNYQYRRRPVVLEAFQMTEARREDNSDWPEWLNRAWNKLPQETGAVFPSHFTDIYTGQLLPVELRNSNGKDKLSIHTLEGNLMVEWNSWIVQGVHGELWAVKDDVFPLTYEPVEAE